MAPTPQRCSEHGPKPELGLQEPPVADREKATNGAEAMGKLDALSASELRRFFELLDAWDRQEARITGPVAELDSADGPSSEIAVPKLELAQKAESTPKEESLQMVPRDLLHAETQASRPFAAVLVETGTMGAAQDKRTGTTLPLKVPPSGEEEAAA